jgi:hypothetical protein
MLAIARLRGRTNDAAAYSSRPEPTCPQCDSDREAVGPFAAAGSQIRL